ncbi:MAG: glucosaminidase domain-containing protein [Rikenellaceae bacterium]|jgi:hypothetical protein|nr:glucosaminidase domain-containing protein [Rikenellaceae bacterium]
MKKIVLLAVAVVTAAVAAGQKISRAEYLERYKGIAVADMEKYGIPASIKMAQGMLESDYGNSRLAREANNHFGIKCKSDWTGSSVFHDDDQPNECFRQYLTAEESWHDHSEFLDRGGRYQFLFELDPLDYKAWARGLKKAGYATNPRYPELLIKIIEDNSLWLLDQGRQLPMGVIVARQNSEASRGSSEAVPAEQVDVDSFVIAMYCHNGYEIYSCNGSRFIVAREGDDLAKLAWLFGIGEGKLRRFNDLGSRQNIAAGNMVYIQAKKSELARSGQVHTATAGETLHSISQRYGIKMRSLARRNRLSPDAQLAPGQQIKL